MTRVTDITALNVGGFIRARTTDGITRYGRFLGVADGMTRILADGLEFRFPPDAAIYKEA